MQSQVTPTVLELAHELAPSILPGPYTQREEVQIKREAEGEVSYNYVENNGKPNNSMYLIGLKNIYAKQLPNMPKEYICRLLFDRRHRSMALVKRSGAVVGGITYRAFHTQGFGEIAFCAITSSEQVKGYGTRLMNHTKEAGRTKDRLTHFLTYADNNAVGYFEKQGFTKTVTLARDRWVGFIKDYDGGTLMECVIHPKVPATAFPTMIREQRAYLSATLRTLSCSHLVHPGLHHWRPTVAAGGPHLSGSSSTTALVGYAAEKAGSVKRKHVAIESIPGVLDSGWQQEVHGFGGSSGRPYRLLLKDGAVHDANLRTLHQLMVDLLELVCSQEDAWPFREPVAVEQAPDYYEVIKNPMDLATMEERLKSGCYYVSIDMFNADLGRIFENCRNYNAPDSIYFKVANKLAALVKSYLASHLIFDED